MTGCVGMWRFAGLTGMVVPRPSGLFQTMRVPFRCPRFSVGDEEADDFNRLMREHRDRERTRMVFAPGVNYDADAALMALPAPFFLNAVEYALKSIAFAGRLPVVDWINRALAKVGVSYRFDYGGTANCMGIPESPSPWCSPLSGCLTTRASPWETKDPRDVLGAILSRSRRADKG